MRIPVLIKTLIIHAAHRKTITIIMLAVFMCGILYEVFHGYEMPWKGNVDQPNLVPMDVSTIIIESMTVNDTIDCFGQIVFREKANISSKVSGRLAKISIAPGQRVKKGEVIAEIEKLPFEITLKQQTSELEIARRALELTEAKLAEAVKGIEIRLKAIKKARAELNDKKATFENMENILHNKTELYKAGGISRSEYESVKTQHTTLYTNYEHAKTDLEIQEVGYRDQDIIAAGYKVPASETERAGILKIINTKIEMAEVESARARVSQAENSLISTRLILNETYIRSPLSGVIAVRSMETGEMVREDSVIATVMDISRVYISVILSEKEVRRIRKGLEVTFTVDALPDRKCRAIVETITPLLDSKTRTFEVRGISENRDGSLLPGMFSRAIIDTGKNKKGIMIPASALVRGGDGRTEVYLVRNNMVVKENVVTGNESDGNVQILEGLKEGDRIVVSGLNNIYQGMIFDK